MRRSLSFVAVLAFAVLPMLAWAAEKAKPQPPALPDYTAAPFAKVGSGVGTVLLHKEWGEVETVMYANAHQPAAGVDLVIICINNDDQVKYALWQHFSDDTHYISRTYLREDGKWVFEQESPVREIPKRVE